VIPWLDPESHPFFGMLFYAPDCHPFCGNRARSGDGGQNASKSDVRNSTFFWTIQSRVRVRRRHIEQVAKEQERMEKT
jgi:hypothetical protein